jgi:hypothetical protein
MSAPADNTPLRLRDAAAIAFPMGGMTERGLRREAKLGRLRTYRMAGKDFTTLTDVADMVKACAVMAPKLITAPPVDTMRSLEAALDALDKL